MTDNEARQFKDGDIVTVFEGTHHYVRGHRATKFIGRVVGFDIEKQLWKVLTQNLTLTLPQAHTQIPTQTQTLTLAPTLTLTLTPNLNLNNNTIINSKVRNAMMSQKGKPILVDGRFMQFCRTFEISPFANEDRLNLRTVGEYTRRRLLRNADEKQEWALKETKDKLQTALGTHAKQQAKWVAEKVILTLGLSRTLPLVLTLTPFPGSNYTAK
jgi:hypothetical protein